MIRVTGERDERMVVQGPRGPQGNQGNQGNPGHPGTRGEQGMRGPAGLSRPVRRALVYLFTLSMALAAFSLFWTVHEVHASQVAIQAAQHREQVSQQQAGAILGEKLCTTFGRLAALKPPSGSPAKNPSRAFEQSLHATLDELGTDLGCKLPLVPDRRG